MTLSIHVHRLFSTYMITFSFKINITLSQYLNFISGGHYGKVPNHNTLNFIRWGHYGQLTEDLKNLLNGRVLVGDLELLLDSLTLDLDGQTSKSDYYTKRQITASNAVS